MTYYLFHIISDKKYVMWRIEAHKAKCLMWEVNNIFHRNLHVCTPSQTKVEYEIQRDPVSYVRIQQITLKIYSKYLWIWKSS